jgi:uncharacterized membrane protein YfcA
MGLVPWAAIALIGALVGFLGGLFGKGGSAIATPLLAAVGVPPIVAVASPLPATIPGTLVAFWRYREVGVFDRDVIRWSIVVGVPATVAGAVLTRWVGGGALVRVTDVLIIVIGARVLLWSDREESTPVEVPRRLARIVITAVVVGFLAGFLANAGGFLLVPLYLAVVRLPIKTALSCSLAVASVLAVPGTIVHAALGHIDWSVTLVFGAASIPLSSLGARTALQMNSTRLERVFGAGLLILGIVFLFLR